MCDIFLLWSCLLLFCFSLSLFFSNPFFFKMLETFCVVVSKLYHGYSCNEVLTFHRLFSIYKLATTLPSLRNDVVCWNKIFLWLKILLVKSCSGDRIPHMSVICRRVLVDVLCSRREHCTIYFWRLSVMDLSLPCCMGCRHVLDCVLNCPRPEVFLGSVSSPSFLYFPALSYILLLRFCNRRET